MTTRHTEANLPGEGADRRPVPMHLERHVRAAWSLPLFASIVSLAFVLASATDSSPGAALVASASSARAATDSQVLASAGGTVGSIERITWQTSRVATSGVAPAAGTPDAGTAQALAAGMVAARGWSTSEFDCLVALWNRESRWNVYAHNTSSGAYGIPQALPGSKMATAGADWATNPVTQITWGLGYIAARYGTPCGAWAHSENVGWY